MEQSCRARASQNAARRFEELTTRLRFAHSIVFVRKESHFAAMPVLVARLVGQLLQRHAPAGSGARNGQVALLHVHQSEFQTKTTMRMPCSLLQTVPQQPAKVLAPRLAVAAWATLALAPEQARRRRARGAHPSQRHKAFGIGGNAPLA